ncbi:MAG: hypothetical protein GEV05_24600 [Betaproteobacteria bacterium]|nr:hypothetical protein [Betaproteobacteria bacterium]
MNDRVVSGATYPSVASRGTSGVGADKNNKRQNEPSLPTASVLVTNLIEQYGALGKVHHALATRAITRSGAHAQSNQVTARHNVLESERRRSDCFDLRQGAAGRSQRPVAVHWRVLGQAAGFRLSLNV